MSAAWRVCLFLWLVFGGNRFHFNWLSAVLAFHCCVLVLEDPETTCHMSPDGHIDCRLCDITGLVTVDSFGFDRMGQFEHNGEDPNHYEMHSGCAHGEKCQYLHERASKPS